MIYQTECIICCTENSSSSKSIFLVNCDRPPSWFCSHSYTHDPSHLINLPLETCCLPFASILWLIKLNVVATPNIGIHQVEVVNNPFRLVSKENWPVNVWLMSSLCLSRINGNSPPTPLEAGMEHVHNIL